jgi:cytochrome c-type biogenesis protein CcmH
MGRLRNFGAALVFLALFATSAVYAQEPTLPVDDNDVNRVSRELYCPICENTPLDVCETQACEDWRQLVREKLEAGQTDQEIIDYFANIYGERARATPSTRGFSRYVWIAPIVASVIALAFFARTLRQWLARGAAEPTQDIPATTLPLGELGKDDQQIDEYVARLEQEIRES